MRTLFIVFGLLTVLLIFLTFRVTNSNRDLIRYTGRWGGGFTVDTIQNGPDTEAERKRWRLEGYLQIYLTNRRYVIHLEGEQQAIDVEGTWTAKGDRVTLTPKDVKIDDQGGEDKRDPNKKYIPNEDVLNAYHRPLTLVQTKDLKAFHGLPVSIGRLIGKHDFDKG